MLSRVIFLICCILMGDIVIASKPLSILVVEPVPSPSHHVWTEHLVKGLLRKGHHVHAVSILETKIKGKLAQNLTYAVFDDLMDTYDESNKYDPLEWQKYSVFYTAYFVYQWGINACDTMIKTKPARDLLKVIKTVEYDVIVQDVTSIQCFYGLWEIAKGKPPIVGYIPFGATPYLKDYIGGPSYPTVRSYTHAAIAKPEGLWLRTWNTLYYIVDDLIRHYYFFPIIQRLTEEYVGHAIRPLHKIERESINIVLINSHSALESAIPMPPNTLEIAGLNAQAVQPIAGEVIVTYPEDVRIFLDGAKNGAIIISLGTNVKWKHLNLDTVKSVIRALSKLKQRVLWKLDIEVPFEIPENVMVMKWMPQSEVLSHKNVRAIWTHGGLLSAQEAIWKGVPMIVMPFFGDQKSNTRILVAKGVAIYLDITTLSTQSILHAVEEILYNESYTRNMKRLSSEFRDRPIPPLDLAVWSVEYTVRHPNGTLVTPLRSQSWVERNLIDVYAFLFLSFFIILLSIFFVIKLLINLYYNYVYTASNLRKSKQA
ncbi:UDP-glucuronosyltransferase 1-9-like [Temnothorax curvispinosus]|uniref:UDP-glucuronosyltransferase 1-9-like n=1 Tax=Temnothorax curvispinosus TaxID=300111 RepID=A0A6J1PW55_9HYME|nr:UDP-glucuronosyltransferase 1-9-like [Temnothorax curvispinosus]XP_024878630.1 UDP-glucuronosyltransferase 1-9-like [Temnothorax curvispinosus]